MTLPMIAELPYAKEAAPALALKHTQRPINKTQARLRGRVAFVPDLDLDSYRFRAVIDWIEFRAHLGRTTQVQHLQKVLRQFLDRDSHIVPEDEGPGSTFSVCRIKVQEPASLALIVKLYRGITQDFGEATVSSMTGIEISVDAYPKKPCHTARALLLGAMQRTIWTGRDIWTQPSSRPRFAFGNGRSETLKVSPSPDTDSTGDRRSQPEQYTPPMIDSTLYLGARGEDVMIRIMEKVIDRQRSGGSHVGLAEDAKRVRIEVTILGAELDHIGLTDIGSLQRFRITALQKRYFQFKLPTFSQRLPVTRSADVVKNYCEVMHAQTYLRSGILGLIARAQGQKIKSKNIRGHARTVLISRGKSGAMASPSRRVPAYFSYDRLNRKVALALQQLDKREQTRRKNMGPASSSR